MKSASAIVRATICAAAVLSVSSVFARDVLPPGHKAFECAACHGTAAPAEIPKNQACLGCHGPWEKLIDATSSYALNPHASPHWGADIPCGTCHKQHEKPTVQCAACHRNQQYRAR